MTHKHPGSVLVIPFVDSGTVVLVHQYRVALDAWIWEFPAGTMREGETPHSTAVRECEEEIKLSPTELRYIGTAFIAPGSSNESMTFFKGFNLIPINKKLDEDERLTVHRIPISEVLTGKIQGQQIADLKTLWGMTHLR